MEDHGHNREGRIKTVILLNVCFTIIEIIGGLWTNSMAILADALHDFGDSVALIISWFSEKKAKQAPDSKRTFGYQRLSLFSALFSALVLVSGSLIVLSQTIPRLYNSEHVNASGMIGIAVIGIIFNLIGFFKLKRGASMNERVLTWHLLEDVFGWVVIFIGAVIMKFWDFHFIDPIMTIGFTAFILWGVGKNLKETVNILLEGVPNHINMEGIRSSLLAISGVKAVHDVHVWSLDGEVDIFTGHVVIEDKLMSELEKIQKTIKEVLKQHHIEHSTVELETESFCSGMECLK